MNFEHSQRYGRKISVLPLHFASDDDFAP
jgi:hypothetical protein